MGYSDGADAEDSIAELLSKLRAGHVKVELWNLGAKTAPVVGFGAARKLTDNWLPNARNDRVEVWVYRDIGSVRHPDAALTKHQPRQGAGDLVGPAINTALSNAQ